MPCLWIKHTGFKGQEKALESLYTIYTGYPQPAKPYIIGHQKTPIQESEENQRFHGSVLLINRPGKTVDNLWKTASKL